MFLNQYLDEDLKAQGVYAVIQLNYDQALPIPQFNAAVADPTHQVQSILVVQNLSTLFTATFAVSPSPDSTDGIYTIKAGQPQRIFPHNWNGSALKVANISQESATIKVFLT